MIEVGHGHKNMEVQKQKLRQFPTFEPGTERRRAQISRRSPVRHPVGAAAVEVMCALRTDAAEVSSAVRLINLGLPFRTTEAPLWGRGLGWGGKSVLRWPPWPAWE